MEYIEPEAGAPRADFRIKARVTRQREFRIIILRCHLIYIHFK